MHGTGHQEVHIQHGPKDHFGIAIGQSVETSIGIMPFKESTEKL